MRLEHYHYWHAMDYVQWDSVRDVEICGARLADYCQRHHLNIERMYLEWGHYENAIWAVIVDYEEKIYGADPSENWTTPYITYDLTSHLAACTRIVYDACLADPSLAHERGCNKNHKREAEFIFGY